MKNLTLVFDGGNECIGKIGIIGAAENHIWSSIRYLIREIGENSS